MKNYKYSAKNADGRTVNGKLQAQDRDEVVGELKRRNLTVLGVKEVGSPFKKGKRTARAGKPRKQDELVVFTRQLATMITSGITLLESVEILAELPKTPSGKVDYPSLRRRPGVAGAESGPRPDHDRVFSG